MKNWGKTEDNTALDGLIWFKFNFKMKLLITTLKKKELREPKPFAMTDFGMDYLLRKNTRPRARSNKGQGLITGWQVGLFSSLFSLANIVIILKDVFEGHMNPF